MKAKRWPEIDVLYAIGSILVVFGHSHSSDWSTFSGTILNPIITFIYTFHMPLFFFISGFLFLNSTSLEKNGYKSWLLNKAERLLTPYIVLSIIALIPKYYVENHGFKGFTLKYLLETVLVPRAGVWGHFWFLPVLFLIYVVFGVWKESFWAKKNEHAFLAVFILAVALYFQPFSSQWLGFSDFKEAAIFFVIGMITNHFLKENKQMMSIEFRCLWILVGLSVSFVLFHFYYGIK